MRKIKVNLFDSLLSPHSDQYWGFSNFSSEFPPTKIEWVKQGPSLGFPEFEGATVFTDKDILSSWVDRVQTTYKIAWILECDEIHPFARPSILQVEDKFNYIFTHDPALLNRGPKYIKNLIGTSRVSNKDCGIHPKNKLVSLIASQQQISSGHRLRHAVAQSVKDKYPVDLWGAAYRPFGKNVADLGYKFSTTSAVRQGKNEPLQDYFFSISIINSKQDNYFTESLVDLFRQGCIPIFWGCDNIGDYFNDKGIIKFNTIPELLKILDSLSPAEYYNRLDYVKENFNLCKEYLSQDDTFAVNLLNTIPSLINE